MPPPCSPAHPLADGHLAGSTFSCCGKMLRPVLLNTSHTPSRLTRPTSNAYLSRHGCYCPGLRPTLVGGRGGGGSLPAPPLRVHSSASRQCPPRAHGPARLLKAPSASVTHPTALLVSEFAKAPFLGVGASQPVNPELRPQVGPAELSHSSAKRNQSRLH